MTKLGKVVRDFLMQCFQKDPNLRVSARKLLKHPWIVNAKRSDAIVPKKPTEYDEAVKSVQQWNEALKSPDAGSLRKASRPLSSSPVPRRREPNNVAAAPARGPLSLATPRVNPEKYRSPSNTADNNWDDDFASAISPSALQLPHLRPHDNFGGLLSSEKLKAFASFETVTEEANWDDEFEGDLTVKSPLQLTNPDPLETIKPFNPTRGNNRKSQINALSKTPNPKRSPTPQSRFQDFHPKYPPVKAKSPIPSTLSYKKTSKDNFSDVLAGDGKVDRKMLREKVGTTLLNRFRLLSMLI